MLSIPLIRINLLYSSENVFLEIMLIKKECFKIKVYKESLLTVFVGVIDVDKHHNITHLSASERMLSIYILQIFL